MELGLWLLLLLPGLIYSIWRIAGRYPGCPVCNSKNIIPLGTPMAKMILNSQGGAVPGQPIQGEN